MCSPETLFLVESIRNMYDDDDSELSDEITIFNHIVDCVAAMHDLYLDRINSANEKNGGTPDKNKTTVRKNIHSGFIGHIGKVLKESLVTSSPAFQDMENSELNRIATSNHILVKFPALSMQRVTSKNIPLVHYAVYNTSSIELIRILYDANPDAVAEADNQGALPLHWATLNVSTPEIAHFLVNVFPEAASFPDDSGYLPLHWAVNQPAPDMSIVQALLSLHPDAASTPSKAGTQALHWAVNRSEPNLSVIKELIKCDFSVVKHPCGDGWLPLHYCVNRPQPCLPVLRMLLDKYPEGATHRNKDGQLPIHRLLDRHNPCRRAVKLLLEASPDSLRVSDNEGYLPLHVCLDGAQPPSVRLVKMLVHSCFPSVRHKTLDGYLPVHLAVKMEDQLDRDDDDESDADSKDGAGGGETKPSRSLAIVQELVSLYPEGVHEVAVDVVPLQEGADPVSWEGAWRKHRWTPMSLALSRGRSTDLAKLLRPYRKKKTKGGVSQSQGTGSVGVGSAVLGLTTSSVLDDVSPFGSPLPVRGHNPMAMTTPSSSSFSGGKGSRVPSLSPLTPSTPHPSGKDPQSPHDEDRRRGVDTEVGNRPDSRARPDTAGSNGSRSPRRRTMEMREREREENGPGGRVATGESAKSRSSGEAESSSGKEANKKLPRLVPGSGGGSSRVVQGSAVVPLFSKQQQLLEQAAASGGGHSGKALLGRVVSSPRIVHNDMAMDLV